MELYKLTAHEAKELINKKEINAEELTKASIERIQNVDNNIKAFITLTDDSAIGQAKLADKALSGGGALHPLAGIPMALKDNMCTQGIRTTCASKMLANFVPPYNATVANKLKSQNAVLMGKLNMDEFAMGSSTETSAFNKTSNPWDLSRVPGGSSGGCAAAVIADEVFYALGSDTGGSIRQPASFCGLVGFKPTYGTVSRYGLVAFASSLDQIGPITKDVTDCAMVLNAIVGHDEFDATSANLNYPDYTAALKDDVKGWKIGVPKEYFGEGLDEEVKQAVHKAIAAFESLGAHVEEISLPHTEYALAVYYILACAEASSNLARYDGVKYGYRTEKFSDLDELYKKSRTEGFGAEVKRRIMLGNYALSSGYYEAYYLKALKVRTLIKEDFDKAFQNYDLVLCPTSPTTAFRFGEKKDPLQMYLSDVYTIPVNIAGLPGISIPCGFDGKGMPIGLQLIGKAFGESKLLQGAYTFEQNTDYHIKRPAFNWGGLG